MWLIRTLRSMLRTSRRSRPGYGRFRPRLEALEDRFAPAQLTVTKSADPPTLTIGTLRWAVSHANADAAKGISDTITFSSALNGATITLYQGELVLRRAGSGTITINGDNEIAINGINASRVLLVDPGVHATLIGLTIENGNAGAGYGGGILNYGTLGLYGDEFSGNTATYGGAIFNNGAKLTVSTWTPNNGASIFASLLNGNSAGYGGAIYTESNASISSTSFTANHVTADGGAIGNTGTLVMSGSSLSNNWAGNWGGGIFNESGTATLTNCTISSNVPGITNAIYGGGIFNESPVLMQINGGSISGNSATYGGGIYNEGNVIMSASLISGNSAQDGGGIYSTVRLTVDQGSNVYSNRAYVDGGGIYNAGTATIDGGLPIGSNTATAGEGAWVEDNRADSDGGGILNAGTLYVQNYGIIYGNQAYAGGGIDNGVKCFTQLSHWSYIESNTASDVGGGILNAGTTLNVLSESVVESNTATLNGGGIYNTGSLTIDNSWLGSNTANGDGGGLYNTGSAWVQDQSTVYDNTAETGAGLDNLHYLNVSNSVLEDNHASWNGGAIANWNTAYVSGCTFENSNTNSASGNTAGNDGGGIYNGWYLWTTNSLFQNETASNLGGAIYTYGATLAGPVTGKPVATDFFMVGNHAAAGSNVYYSPLSFF